MTPRVAILGYGCGNLASVVNAVRKVGGDPQIVDTPFGIDEAERIILPGQGAFRRLHPHLVSQLDNAHALDKPILGICLGMQLMCESSEEAPGVKGLGWFPWKVERVQAKRLPHVGWNKVVCHGDFYFCHSYAIRTDLILSAGSTEVDGDTFRALVQCDHLWATQFHPEKSGKAGLEFLREFLKL